MKIRSAFAATGATVMIVAMFAAPRPVFARDAAAVAPAAAPAPLQLVQPGDRSMTCPALAGEINSLASAQLAPQQIAAAPEKKKKKGGMGLFKVLSSAVPIMGPLAQLGGGMGGALASTAMGAAQSAASSGAMESAMQDSMQMANDAARQAMAGPSIAEQRKARLMTIFESKGC